MLSAPISSTLSNPLRGKDKSNAALGLFLGEAGLFDYVYLL